MTVFIIPTILILIIWIITADGHYRADSSQLAQAEKKTRWRGESELTVITFLFYYRRITLIMSTITLGMTRKYFIITHHFPLSSLPSLLVALCHCLHGWLEVGVLPGESLQAVDGLGDTGLPQQSHQSHPLHPHQQRRQVQHQSNLSCPSNQN